MRLALHTWTLDTTPLADALLAARAAGWDAVELRRLDFTRAVEAGGPAEDVIALVRASGRPGGRSRGAGRHPRPAVIRRRRSRPR